MTSVFDKTADATGNRAVVGDLGAFGELIDQLAGVIDGLQGYDLTALSDADVPTALQALVRQTRRLPTVRIGLVAEVVERGLPVLSRDRSIGAYLRSTVNITTAEGNAWARDVEYLAPRRSMSCGEPLPARLPEVAAAVTDGEIDMVAARMIIHTMRRVPSDVSPDERADGEARLVRGARRFDPVRLERLCRRFLECVDPDGTLGSSAPEQARKRSFVIGRQDKWGMFPVRGFLDPHTGATLQAALAPLAAPRTTKDTDGTVHRDDRTPEQRNQDALGELAARALAGGDLPVRHGLRATLLLTMRLEDLEARTGCVSTAHGGAYPIRDLLRIAADTGVVPIVMDSDGMVLHHGEEQRLGTVPQRNALQVMDIGCTWPGCDVPGIWCECAHGQPFRTSRRTTIDDLALLCGYHHHIADSEEWTIERISGRVWITAPAWIDPAQVPRTNEYWKPLLEEPFIPRE